MGAMEVEPDNVVLIQGVYGRCTTNVNVPLMLIHGVYGHCIIDAIHHANVPVVSIHSVCGHCTIEGEVLSNVDRVSFHAFRSHSQFVLHVGSSRSYVLLAETTIHAEISARSWGITLLCIPLRLTGRMFGCIGAFNDVDHVQ
eukprot:1207062-Amphidinium_carterae.1